MKLDLCTAHGASVVDAWSCIEMVLNAMPTAVCLLSAGVVRYANPAFLRLIEAETQVVIDRRLIEIAPCDFARAISGERASGGKGPVVLRSPQGDLISADATAVPVVLLGEPFIQATFTRLRTNPGELYSKQTTSECNIAPASDGTQMIAEANEQQPSDAQLAHRCQMLQDIVDRVPAFIAYVDAHGRYQWFNRSYEEWCGIKASDALGREWLDVLEDKLGSEYVGQLRPYVDAALAGSSITFEASVEFGGARHDLLISYAPDTDDTGATRGFVVLTTDWSDQRRVREELLASEERFCTLIEAIPPIIWTATPSGQLDYVSDRFYERTGRTPEEAQGSGWLQVIHPDDRAALVESWKASVSCGVKLENSQRLLQFDGTYRWYLSRALPQRDSTGNVIRWVGVSADIHEQVTAEESLREAKRRYKLLFNDNPLPMWTYDCETLQITSVNNTAARLYGYSCREFLSMQITDLLPREHPSELGRIGQQVGRVRHRRKDGSLFWAEVTEHELGEVGITMHLVVAQDITEEVRLNEELQYRIGHDPLTGLPNRTLLRDRFQQAVFRAKRHHHKVAVMAIDFDRFKQVNDTFGHQVGDEFLIAGTRRIRGGLRDSDTLARTGGDEFIVIAEDIDGSETCARVAQGIIDALHSPVQVGNTTLQPTISLGLAIYPDDGQHIDELMRRADYGLYDAKRAGRNCWKHHLPSSSYGIKEAMHIERSLRTAVEEQRLVLHYQPIVTASAEIAATEALLRLTDPKLGLLLPENFISIAERSGLIHSIGLWVVREACRQSREWQNSGLKPMPIAVNVSASQFQRGSLVEEIRSALDEFNLEPRLLQVELTESLVMENTEQTFLQLGMLKDLGVRIAVDDFGKGYSSLSYLHTLPLDVLKIDRSFIKAIDESQSNAIVKTVVELGRNLGFTIVAEGIETKVQHEHAVRLGCDLFQGYFYSRPAPANEMAAFCSTSRSRE